MSKHNICLFSEDSGYQYTLDLSRGMRDEIMQEEYGFIVFPLFVSELTLDSVQSYFRQAAEAASALNADLYILPVGILTARFPHHKEHLRDMLDILKDKKVFILEDELDGYECLGKDNEKGMRDLMNHLLEHHQYTNVIMIAGPATSHGSQVREKVYHEEMAKRQLKEIIYRGSFSGNSQSVIEQAIQEHPEVQCFVCANDHLAIEAYRAARKFDKEVGNDIAITGFDDIPRAALLSPPLSTVALPMYQYGRAAGKEALHILKHEPREITVFPSAFILRASCGCSGGLAIQEENRDQLRNITSTVQYIFDRSASFHDEVVYQNCVDIISFLSDDERNNDSQLIALLRDVLDYVPDKYFRKDLFFQDLDAYMLFLIEDHPSVVLEHKRAMINNVFTRYIYNNNRDYKLAEIQQTRSIQRISLQSVLYEDNEHEVWENVFRLIHAANVENAIMYLRNEDNSFYPKAILKDGEISINDFKATDSLFQEIHNDPVPRAASIAVLEVRHEMKGLFVISDPPEDLQLVYSIVIQLNNSLAHMDLITKEKQMINLLNMHNISLRHAAEYDVMTGLLNRRGLMTKLMEGKDFSTGHSVCVFFIDLDRLKYINDYYGHEEGDFAIKSAAELLRKSFRDTDLIARLGGDEFCVFCLMEDSAAQGVMDRISLSFEQFNITAKKQYQISASIGYTSFVVNSDTSFEPYLKTADQNMYESKKAKHVERK